MLHQFRTLAAVPTQLAIPKFTQFTLCAMQQSAP
jgi:hypothetical protein